jgi:hypothetical protein
LTKSEQRRREWRPGHIPRGPGKGTHPQCIRKASGEEATRKQEGARARGRTEGAVPVQAGGVNGEGGRGGGQREGARGKGVHRSGGGEGVTTWRERGGGERGIPHVKKARVTPQREEGGERLRAPECRAGPVDGAAGPEGPRRAFSGGSAVGRRGGSAGIPRVPEGEGGAERGEDMAAARARAKGGCRVRWGLGGMDGPMRGFGGQP